MFMEMATLSLRDSQPLGRALAGYPRWSSATDLEMGEIDGVYFRSPESNLSI